MRIDEKMTHTDMFGNGAENSHISTKLSLRSRRTVHISKFYLSANLLLLKVCPDIHWFLGFIVHIGQTGVASSRYSI